MDIVWDTIALHTSWHIQDAPAFRRRAPEIGIALTGIGTDILDGPAQLPPGYAERVHAAYPRHGGARAFTDALVAQAMANPRKAPPMTMAGEILHQRHPALPYPTWDMILDAGGWDD